MPERVNRARTNGYTPSSRAEYEQHIRRLIEKWNKKGTGCPLRDYMDALVYRGSWCTECDAQVCTTCDVECVGMDDQTKCPHQDVFCQCKLPATPEMIDTFVKTLVFKAFGAEPGHHDPLKRHFPMKRISHAALHAKIIA